MAARGGVARSGVAPSVVAPSVVDWSADLPAGRFTAEIRPGKRPAAGSLVLELRPARGVRVVPPVLRVNVPALVRGRVEGRFPAALRSDRPEGPYRAELALKGPLRIADPDRNDGMLRVEFRYCGEAADRCSVGRVEVPLRAPDGPAG